jgi:hypothetical protein
VATLPARRPAERTRVALRARLTWKDTSGAVRFASVVTRDISASGAFVEIDAACSIPLYRIVHLQLERDARNGAPLPERLRDGRVLSAIWRVGPRRRSTGTPEGYALRFMVDTPAASARQVVRQPMAVAS